MPQVDLVIFCWKLTEQSHRKFCSYNWKTLYSLNSSSSLFLANPQGKKKEKKRLEFVVITGHGAAMARLDQYQGNCNQLKFLNFLDKKKLLSFFFFLWWVLFFFLLFLFLFSVLCYVVRYYYEIHHHWLCFLNLAVIKIFLTLLLNWLFTLSSLICRYEVEERGLRR